MTILITGVAGQVGRALVPVCRGLGEVVSADRAMLDLSKPQSLGATLSEIAPSLIINPAAYTAVDKAEEETELAFCVNATAPGIMARWAADHDVPLVHFSTDYVFDGSGMVPFGESDEPGPLSVYGKSKLGGETEIGLAGGPSLIVRTSWVYAANGKSFFRTIARVAAERDELRIVSDQWGAPTSAAFIASAVAAMLGDGLDQFRQRRTQLDGLVHLAAGGETNWYHFACEIIEGMRQRRMPVKSARVLPIPTSEYPTPAKRPQNSRLDLRRLSAVFGITPPAWQSLLSPELDTLAG